MGRHWWGAKTDFTGDFLQIDFRQTDSGHPGNHDAAGNRTPEETEADEIAQIITSVPSVICRLLTPAELAIQA